MSKKPEPELVVAPKHEPKEHKGGKCMRPHVTRLGENRGRKKRDKAK